MIQTFLDDEGQPDPHCPRCKGTGFVDRDYGYSVDLNLAYANGAFVDAVECGCDTLELDEYWLQCVGGEPVTWRCFKDGRFVGIVFQHPTHWSNAVDSIQYSEPEDAVLGLEDYMAVAGRERAAECQGRAVAT